MSLPRMAAEPAAAPAVTRCPEEATSSRVFSFVLAGNRAGYHLECRMPDGSGHYVFEFNDRGRGPSLRSRITRDAAGIPTAITVDGNDYLKNTISERFADRERPGVLDQQGGEGRESGRGPRVLPEPVGHACGNPTARESGAGRAGQDARAPAFR